MHTTVLITFYRLWSITCKSVSTLIQPHIHWLSAIFCHFLFNKLLFINTNYNTNYITNICSTPCQCCWPQHQIQQPSHRQPFFNICISNKLSFVITIFLIIIINYLFTITNYYTNYITNVCAISARPAPASQPKTITLLAICIGNKLSFIIIIFLMIIRNLLFIIN